MENLHLAATSLTPFVSFKTNEGILDLRGRSSPDNSLGFYSPIFQFLDSYLDKPLTDNLKINVNLEYFNTSSLKCIFQMLKKLSDINKHGIGIEVNWYYEEEDEDMLETGEDIADLLNLEFNFVPEDNNVYAPVVN